MSDINIQSSGGTSGTTFTPGQQITGPTLQEIFFDSLAKAASLDVNAKPAANSKVTILDFAGIIDTNVRELKKSLVLAQFLDDGLIIQFFRDLANNMATLTELLNQVLLQSIAWNDPVTGQSQNITTAYANLVAQFNNYNSQVDAVNTQDQAAITALNNAFDHYKNLTPADLDTPAKQDAEKTLLNNAISTFNGYALTRPNLQTYIDTLNSEITAYNNGIDQVNAVITQINAGRANRAKPLPPYALLDKVTPAMISPDPTFKVLNLVPNISDDLTPGNVDQWLYFFSEPVSTQGTNALINALENAGTPLEQAQIDAAITAAQGAGPYENESLFFKAVRAQLVSSMGSRGGEIFDQGIFNVPVVENPTTNAQAGKVTVNATYPTPPGTVPHITLSDFLGASYIPSAVNFLEIVQQLITQLELDSAEDDIKRFYFRNRPGQIAFPVAFVEKVNKIFSSDTSAAGNGTGLGGSSLGVHTKGLEAVLSDGKFKAIARDLNMPISGRAFARLELGILDILSKSALLGAMPASSLLAETIGSAGAISPVVELAVSLGFSSRLQNVIEGNVTQALANGTINQLAFGARFSVDEARNGVAQSEQQLKDAINSGDPVKIGDAFEGLVDAELQLAAAGYLAGTIGTLSVGELARFTTAAAATMNVSLLAVALGVIGKALDIPGFVPQVFANYSGMPTGAVLAAMNSGSGIGQVFDSPIQVLYLKNSIVNGLAKQGFSSDATAEMVNNAINEIALQGGINTLSHLESALEEAFNAQGLGRLGVDTTALAATAANLVRGDIGSVLEYTIYNPGGTPSEIAAGVLSGINTSGNLSSTVLGQFSDPNLGSLLTDAVSRAVAKGGYETQRDYRDQILEELGTSGLSPEAQMFLANSAANYGVYDIGLNPFGVTGEELANLETAATDAIAKAFAANVEQIAEIVKEAIAHAFAHGPFSSADEFRVVVKEEIVRSALSINLNGSNTAFDNAMGLAGSSVLLGVAGLLDAVGSSVDGLTQGIHGTGVAALKSTVIERIFDEKNPTSLVNRLREAVDRLTADQDAEQLASTIKGLEELLKILTTPNATLGYVFSTLTDHPSNFIGSLRDAGSVKRNLDIPV